MWYEQEPKKSIRKVLVLRPWDWGINKRLNPLDSTQITKEAWTRDPYLQSIQIKKAAKKATEIQRKQTW